MRIPEETVNDIRNSADIVDVIGHYIPLIKKGKSFNAVCPFHDDHDPSLSISRDKQIYKCFVCGNGGNVFTFVSNYKKISYPEAVKEVADIIGKPLNIEFNTPKKENRYQRLYDVLNDYIGYTSYILSGSKLGVEAHEYLINRGLSDDIIKDFNIGYNPDGDRVYQTLKAKEYTDEEMIKVNIARMGNSGMNEVFKKRIVFPIHDKYGNPIAFTARDFMGFSEAKYINSSETIIYTKGDTLYNYHRAKLASKQNGKVIVCEGVMDVIAYKRAGIDNVVATLGTACSEKQIELLKELAPIIILSYDGDKAGKAANIKNGYALLSKNANVEVIDNNTGLDPDEIINKYDKNALRDLSSKRVSYIDYALNYYKESYNLNNYSERKDMTLKMSGIIELLNDDYDKENYYNELYEITRIRKTDRPNEPKNEYNRQWKSFEKSISLDGITKAEYIILIEMVLSKDAVKIYNEELGYLLDENNQKLANIIIDEYRKNDNVSLSRMLDEIDDKALKDLILSLATYDSLPSVYDKETLLGSINKVKIEIKKRKLAYLRKSINDIASVDQEKAIEYIKERDKLIKELGG